MMTQRLVLDQQMAAVVGLQAQQCLLLWRREMSRAALPAAAQHSSHPPWLLCLM
jgi:hypothetical protein